MTSPRSQCWTIAAALTLAGWSAVSPTPASAQLSRGFEKSLPAYATGEERNRQTDLRVMEVQFKPMRMLWVDVTNPATGQKERKLVWYLVYRAISRPAEGRADETDSRPVNDLDPPPKPVFFMPEFVLTTYDDPANPVPLAMHHDEILPEALAAIRQIEQRPAALFEKRKIESTLGVIQPFPDPIAADAPDEQQDWVYGVALWTGIDPNTDYFQVTMRGFSNAYDASQAGPDGNPHPWRKAIIQKFIRRGDRFDQTQREFEWDGDPEWIYQPDETQWTNWTPMETAAN